MWRSNTESDKADAGRKYNDINIKRCNTWLIVLDLCWNLFIRHLEMSVAKYHLMIQYTRNLDFMLFFLLLRSSNSFAWTRTCNELARDQVSACERHSSNDGLMLGQRLRRWPNIKPSLVSRVVPGHEQPYYSAVVSFFHNNNRKWHVITQRSRQIQDIESMLV